MKVLVLAGGKSREREVSLNTGAAIAQALQRLGHLVKMIDTGDGRVMIEGSKVGLLTESPQLAQDETTGDVKAVAVSGQFSSDELTKFDCVFLALHGGIGENGTLQAFLELLNVPYTGSGVEASALAMDKYRAKLLFEAVGVPTPRTIFFGDADRALDFCNGSDFAETNYPIIVKPNAEGSTVGLTLTRDHESLLRGIKLAGEHDKHVLIEEYIPGRELTVAVLGAEALPVIEIVPKSGFYDYASKYTSGASDYICPAVIEAEVERLAKEYARTAFDVLGCYGYARVDFRLSPQNELFCLEVNTLPGMTATSLVPKAARAAGISFEELANRLVEFALSRSRQQNKLC